MEIIVGKIGEILAEVQRIRSENRSDPISIMSLDDAKRMLLEKEILLPISSKDMITSVQNQIDHYQDINEALVRPNYFSFSMKVTIF